TAIFRIVQECLTNIHRHSGSSTAKIDITKDNNNILVTVWDEGKGIPAEILDRHNIVGVGIRGMQERVRELGGQMQIRPNSPGTIVEVTLPCVRRQTPDGRPDAQAYTAH